jgi:hypothetical protein
MSNREARWCRACVVVAVGLVLLSTTGRTEGVALPSRTLTSVLATVPAPSLSSTRWVFDVEPAELSMTTPPVFVRESLTTRPRPRLLVPLYVSFGALQIADAHSTLRAIRAGAGEQNPVFRSTVDRPAAFVAVKASMAASTILLTEQFRASHPTGALVLMAALNSVYATLVTHNYQAAR